VPVAAAQLAAAFPLAAATHSAQVVEALEALLAAPESLLDGSPAAAETARGAAKVRAGGSGLWPT